MIAQIRRGRTRAENRQESEEKEERPLMMSGDVTPVQPDVATDPRRARLYARLRRRFPLRIAVPR